MTNKTLKTDMAWDEHLLSFAVIGLAALSFLGLLVFIVLILCGVIKP